ncbi:gluconokinase [Nocardia miyunensis]|uniref:gluconokinase n=1 Tax=Nocardia miyunensis TaxID=282684 RepID=UPI00082B8F2F|nr:gluconokinase [Nocardia miyunensis]
MTTSRPLIAVMGVSGSGKTTVGRLLANALGVAYTDGDDLHPAANIAKMTSGIPLDDADRLPWLDAVGRWLADHGDRGAVVSCSALKYEYRDRLRAAAPGLYFVALDVPRAELIHRIATRTGHFMHVELLDSQLATLQPLAAREYGHTVDATRDLDTVVHDVLAVLRGGSAGTQPR